MPIDLVPWTEERNWVSEPSPDALVEQIEWCRLVPSLHAVLADPEGRHPLPRYDPRWNLAQACAFWETAVYLLRFLLGWSDPGKGLSWWYQRDFDDQGDMRLKVLREVWCTNGQMDLLAAWYWRGGDDECFEGMRRLAPRLKATSGPTSDGYPPPAWWAEFERRFTGSGRAAHDPFHGGSNALHLGHSRSTAWLSDEPTGWISADTSTHRAALVLDAAKGWYGALAAHGALLPDIGGHSWRVDVFVKPIGWLGTFRRSRDSGLWFLGKHSIHAAGNL